MNPERARLTAVCLFCAALPVSIAGANIGWALIAASLLWLRHGGRPPAWSAARSSIFMPLLFFLAASAAANAFGIHPAKSFGYFNQDAHKLWIACLLLVALEGESSPLPAAAVATGFVVAAATGIGQSALAAVAGQEAVRAHAFVHPVTFGEQMAVGLLGAFCFFLRPPPRQDAGLWRAGAAALGVLAGAALLLSNTRGAMLAATAGFIAVFIIVPDKRRYAALAVPAGAALFLTTELMHWDRSAMRAAYDHFIGGQPLGPQWIRLTLWDSAIRIGMDHPWTGVGHNAFRTVFSDYFAGTLDGTSEWGSAHSLYLHHFAERGLLGLCALAWLLWRLSKRALQRASLRPDAWNLWAWGATVAFLVMNLTEVALQVELVWMLVFFIWCAAESRHRLAENSL